MHAAGTLTLNPTQRRSREAQAAAGGIDRLPNDHGGHYIARRFNGPTDAFNHFAQNAQFNVKTYRALEDRWAKAIKVGQEVSVQITPHYIGGSLRPSWIEVRYEIDGLRFLDSFSNADGK